MGLRIRGDALGRRGIWRTASTLAAASGVALAVAACGAPAAGQAPPGSSVGQATPAPGGATAAQADGGTGKVAKACSLFTSADVQAALGHAVVHVDGSDSPGSGQSLCTYGLDDKGGLLVQIYPTAQSAAGATINEAGSEQVSGLGDSAFWNFPTGLLFVHKGDRGLSISNPYAAATQFADQGASDAANVAARDAEVGLAKLAANKW